MLRGALAAFALALAAAWFWGHGFDPGQRPLVLLLSAAELSLCRGSEEGERLLLAVLGQVFDVESGRRHYGPGGAYSSLAGKDASRAFATGDFSPAGLVDDVSGLAPLEMLTIQNWLSFYHKNYAPVGKVVGRFYDENGAPTEYLRQAEALMAEGQRLQAQEEDKKKQFPPCNSEWSSAGGSRVWCSKQSGGVHRDWSGVPRKLYEPGSSHSHCVCVKAQGQPSSPQMSHRGELENPLLQEYEGCHPLAEWCAVKE
ncbi:neuferricin [Sceloporus undulatus]|uniref:neuferricin n=1 Tax=Sceloporus undulatus TaxID=8520 RepID=UPI001C4BF30E|nr:neuferricin [Sceloporus undulatus]